MGIDGGYFNEGKSSTWTKASSLAALDTAEENNSNLDNDVYGSDDLTLASNLTLSKYPLGVARVDAEEMNVVGVGINSSLLTALESTGAISSRSWAYWHGWTGDNASTQLDGNLVLGGYDSKKTTGSNLTLPLSHQPHCVSGLVITVTDIVLNLASGSNKSIIGSSDGSAFQACVSPDYPHMSLSSDIWDSFLTVSNSTPAGRSAKGGFNFRGMLIDSDGA